MKKYLFFIFILIVPVLYGMETILTSEKLIYAYLPMIPGEQRYFSPEEISHLKEKAYRSIYTYIDFLKNQAESNYQKTIVTLQETITKYKEQEEEATASNLLLAISNTPAKVLVSDDTHQQAKMIFEALNKDLINWKTSFKIPDFHPLLFLKHPAANIELIILDTNKWFDIAKGHVLEKIVDPKPISPPKIKRKHDKYKHSSKEQKLV